MRIIVTVKDVKGHCDAGLRIADKFVIEDSNILLDQSDKICPTAFASIYYRIYALLKNVPISSVSPYVQCTDHAVWGSYGGHGTVIFEVRRE